MMIYWGNFSFRNSGATFLKLGYVYFTTKAIHLDQIYHAATMEAAPIHDIQVWLLLQFAQDPRDFGRTSRSLNDWEGIILMRLRSQMKLWVYCDPNIQYGTVHLRKYIKVFCEAKVVCTSIDDVKTNPSPQKTLAFFLQCVARYNKIRVCHEN